MLDTQEFGDYLQSVGLRDFVGVPCSYLAPLINYAINSERFIMSNNEGDAVAIASGISLCRLNGHSVLSDKSANLRSPTAALTSSKLLVGSLDNANLLKKPAAASPCTASLVFSSQSLECQDSNDMESQANSSNTDSKAESTNQDSSNSKIVSEKCGLQGKSQGSLLNANDRRDFSQLPHLSPQAELPTYGVVLMQNSGLSNALSPLTSLNYTFKIPILGFVSLRGERDSSGKNTDEPQHELLGVITDTLLETCEMKYAFLDSDMDRAKMQVQEALEWLEKGESFFFIVRDKTFSKIALSNAGNSSLGSHSSDFVDFRLCHTEQSEVSTSLESQADSNNTESKPDSKPTQPANKMPTRLEALSVLHTLAKDSKALLLATTGKCGRELYEIEDSPNQLYMVGSMGCVSSLSLGIALKSRQKVIAIDGDSALLMRLGALSTNAYYTRDRDNFCHILLDNESHDSTGGQFNLSPFVDFGSIAKSCGYVNVYIAESLEEFESYVKAFLSAGHSVLSESCGSSEKSLRSFASSKPPCNFSHKLQYSYQILESQTDSAMAESRLSRGAELWKKGSSSAAAKAELEREKRGLPLDCQKSGGFFGAKGDGRGINPFLRKEKTESSNQNPLSCENKKSKNQNISNKDTSPTAQYDKVIESKTNPSNLDSKKGAWFIYLKIQKGSKENLGRPKVTPQEVAQRLSEYMWECSDEF
ncbi:thiamine pyrophosphate-dependent enzyme [Helicobacter cinaedi]|uniref:thiamine pyrophosphate-dependent enzyme n=1 Tax=Helicobacter cinaedi TaxID=213 RepID=UPI000CF01773|nr:thiamine pyrophosphate-dependent enzyme [Helicobacter cinaedi]